MRHESTEIDERGVSTILYRGIVAKLDYEIINSGENYITVVHAASAVHIMLHIGANGMIEMRNALTSEFISKPQTIGQLIEELKRYAS